MIYPNITDILRPGLITITTSMSALPGQQVGYAAPRQAIYGDPYYIPRSEESYIEPEAVTISKHPVLDLDEPLEMATPAVQRRIVDLD